MRAAGAATHETRKGSLRWWFGPESAVQAPVNRLSTARTPNLPQRYGYTYWDTMLGPIFSAVKEVYTKPGKTFIFGPEGEMGGTVFYAPESYQKIVDRRARGVGGAWGF